MTPSPLPGDAHPDREAGEGDLVWCRSTGETGLVTRILERVYSRGSHVLVVIAGEQMILHCPGDVVVLGGQ